MAVVGSSAGAAAAESPSGAAAAGPPAGTAKAPAQLQICSRRWCWEGCWCASRRLQQQERAYVKIHTQGEGLFGKEHRMSTGGPSTFMHRTFPVLHWRMHGRSGTQRTKQAEMANLQGKLKSQLWLTCIGWERRRHSRAAVRRNAAARAVLQRMQPRRSGACASGRMRIAAPAIVAALAVGAPSCGRANLEVIWPGRGRQHRLVAMGGSRRQLTCNQPERFRLLHSLF